MLVAVAASAMTMMAANVVAQAPPGGGQGRGGFGGGQLDKPALMQRFALDADGLNLTADQKGKIDKILDAYIADQTKMRAQMQPGSPPSQEVMGAMRASRDKVNADIGAVLNDGQKKTWEAAMAARRPAGGPGGGPGGPPPGR
jgi:Spy/CpxP family protein refolding chaperone